MCGTVTDGPDECVRCRREAADQSLCAGGEAGKARDEGKGACMASACCCKRCCCCCCIAIGVLLLTNTPPTSEAEPGEGNIDRAVVEQREGETS